MDNVVLINPYSNYQGRPLRLQQTAALHKDICRNVDTGFTISVCY